LKRLIQRTPLWRWAFWVYVPVLFVLTHWPRLELPFPGRPDLGVHFIAFGLWAGLLSLAAYFGGPARCRNALLVWPIAVAYAALDEGLQAIPFVHRHAAVDDWLANVGGVTIGCAAALLLGRWARASGTES
jgi:VanZ family protein